MLANESYHIYKEIKQECYSVETKKYRGKTHLVIPVIMMVEGVHHGSQGPMLHKIDELAKFPESWNGMPVVVNHPEIDGINVSANRPDILEQQEIGRIYNTYVKDMKKLAAEVWLDEEKLREFSKEILDQIQNGIPLEVSLGMFTDEDFITGDFEGEHYESIAKNHRPDHLALLPGAVGACSLADGCGLGVNKDQSEKDLKVAEILFNQSLKKEVLMASECTPCVKKKVDELIANSQGKYTEDDRETLQTLTEAMLDKIAQPVTIEKTVEVERIVEKEVQVNVLSNEDKAALEYGKTQLKENRDRLINGILDNTAQGLWTKELLEPRDLDDLKRIHGMIRKEEIVDYSLNGGTIILHNNECMEEPLLPTGMKFKNK